MSPINSFLAARLISADSAAPTSFSIPSSASAVSAPSASASAAANAGPPPPPVWLGPLGIVALVGFVISFSYMLVVQYRRQCAAAAEAAKNASMVRRTRIQFSSPQLNASHSLLLVLVNRRRELSRPSLTARPSRPRHR